MTVDDQGLPAKRFETLPVDLYVMAESGFLALAQAIDVQDRAKRAELLRAGQ